MTYMGFVLVKSSKVEHLVCCCQRQQGEKTQPTFENVTRKPPHFETEILERGGAGTVSKADSSMNCGFETTMLGLIDVVRFGLF